MPLLAFLPQLDGFRFNLVLRVDDVSFPLCSLPASCPMRPKWNLISFVGSEVLTTMVMKSYVFWDIASSTDVSE
jgi:hypothetical protein